MLYTRKGDGGLTDLADGRRVPKTDTRIDCVGSLDELCSYLGLVRSLLPNALQAGLKHEEALIEQCQRHLLALGAWAAAAEHPQNMPQANDVKEIEKTIDRIRQETGAAFNGFILPGGHAVAAHTHVARTLCRRTERTLLAAGAAEWPESGQALPYLNRFSDFLYALAKKINILTNFQENKR